MRQIEIGNRVERTVNQFMRHYGEVIEIGADANVGRVRVKWTEMVYTPVKWDGKIGRKINNVPFGEPEKTASMSGRPRTWIKAISVVVVG